MKVDFAQKILKKHGWCEGDGLGKNKSGIIKPIKLALKKDKEGIGFDRSLEYSDRWWEDVYNKASQKIDSVDQQHQPKIHKSKSKKTKLEAGNININNEDDGPIQIYNRQKQLGKLKRIYSQEKNFLETLSSSPKNFLI